MSEATFNYQINGGIRQPNINVAEKVSGSFTYDADSNTYSNLNFVSSELAKYDATPATAPAVIPNTSSTPPTSSNFEFRFDGNARLSSILYRADFNSPLTNDGGIIDGELYFRIPNCKADCDLVSNIKLTGMPQVSAVPVPAAAWLFGSSLLGLVGLRRKKQA